MSVRNQNSFHIAIGNCVEKRQRIVAGILRMHSAIQHERCAQFQDSTNSRNLGMPCEVNEFH